MEAFLEYLTGDPNCILRAGPFATGYGKKFQFAAVVCVHRPIAIIKALITDYPRCEACEWHQRLQKAHHSVADELIRRELNARPDWERYR